MFETIKQNKPGMMEHVYDSSTWETKAEGWQVQDQLGLSNKALSQNKTKQMAKMNAYSL